MQNGQKFRWWAIRLGMVLLATVATGVLGLYAASQTQSGRDVLADVIGRSLSDNTTVVHVTGLKGAVGSSFSIEKISAADRDGVFATARDVRINWNPGALLDRTIKLDTLSVGSLTVVRMPRSTADSQSTRALHIRVGKITVAKLAIESPVVGKALLLSATARVSLHRALRDATLDLDLHRIDGDAGTAKVRFDYAAAPARFNAQVHIEEPRGGLLARLAGIPGDERLMVDLQGSGPPDRWRGALKMEAGSDAAVESDVILALRDTTVDITLDGAAKIASLLPRNIRPLADAATSFRIDAALDPSQSVTVRHFTAKSGTVALSGTGRYEIRNQDLAAEITGSLRDNPWLESILPGMSANKMDFSSKVGGTLDLPRLNLSFQTGGLAGDFIKMESVKGTVAVAPVSSTAFDLTGSIEAAEVTPVGDFPSGIVGPTLEAAVTGRIGWNGTADDVILTAATGPLQARLSGKLDQDGLGIGNYSLQIEQIQSVTHAAGLSLDGRLRTEGAFRADLAGSSVEITAKGEVEDLAGLSPELAPILGKRLPVSGTVTWLTGEPIQISALEIGPAIGGVTMTGELDLQSGRLAAEIKATVPSLNPLSNLVTQKIDGQATFSATLDGPIDGLSARGQIGISNLRLNTTDIGDLGIGYTGRLDRELFSARLNLNGVVLEKNFEGNVDGRFNRDALDLSKIELRLGQNRLAGTLRLTLPNRQPSGDIKILLHDLGDAPGAIQFGLSGTGDIRIVAGAGDGNNIDVTAKGKDIHLLKIGAEGAKIGRATARLDLSDPFGRATSAGKVNLENFQFAGMRQGNAKVEAAGNLSKIAWSTTVNAAGKFPISVSTRGTLSMTAQDTSVVVQTLTGEIAAQTMKLDAPFEATWADKKLRVSSMQFSLADGKLELAGSKTESEIDVSGRIDKLPLHLASVFDPRLQITGQVTGDLRISGTPRNPTAAGSFSARDIRPADVEKEAFDGFNVAITVRQDKATASASARLTGPEKTGATVTVETQPIFQLSPLSLATRRGLPITGGLTANGRLGLIDRLVGLGEDRVAGTVSAQANIGGTIDNPKILGEARLREGAYEGAETGTVLRRIDATIAFTGDSAELVSLTATDDDAGRLSGNGTVPLWGTNSSAQAITVTANRFTALRHPLADVVVTGDIKISRPRGILHMDGQLQVDNADIRIPDKLPEQIVELDVTEINGQHANVGQQELHVEPSLAKTIPVSLDLELGFPKRTFVRGRGLDSEWKGSLAITGTSDSPAIKGKLDAVRGTFAFAGKTFVLRNGSVTFPQAASEPEINAVAEAQLTDILARVEISGSVSSPTIRVSSDPALPQEEVLSQILFGRTAGQLSAIQAAQLAQTAATLSGRGGAGIVDRVRQALGVDVLNVEGAEGDATGASLKAGKYVTEDVFLSVTQGTQSGSQKIGVEVRVLPNITVESDISGTADSNIGLNWKWDY